jgi:ribosomal protein L11 methyltransferase
MANLWLTQITLPYEHIDSFMDGFEEIADSMSCFEDGCIEIWKLLIYTQAKPNDAEVNAVIKSLSEKNGIATPDHVTSEVAEIDWVTESQKNFEPVQAGRFFMYPSWRAGEVPTGSIGLQIDPQRAFGTGGHGTTKGCSLVMQKLAENNKFFNMLDMGCGSGILAIVMAYLWPDGNITAVDNDQVCVDTSVENATINHVADKINIDFSDGYNSDIVRSNAPYDLIVANILAAPLIEFAPAANAGLTDGGYIILAGLMTKDADSVIAANTNTGLKLVDRMDVMDMDNWSILTLVKS